MGIFTRPKPMDPVQIALICECFNKEGVKLCQIQSFPVINKQISGKDHQHNSVFLVPLHLYKKMNANEPGNGGQVRQLAAVMFADMTGYTAMMQEDEQRAKLLRDR